jgi:hypothetical protein
MAPGDPGEEHEDDRAEGGSVVDSGTTAAWVRLTVGKKRLDHLPKLVSHLPKRSGHRDLRSLGYVTTAGFDAAAPSPSVRGFETRS